MSVAGPNWRIDVYYYDFTDGGTRTTKGLQRESVDVVLSRLKDALELAEEIVKSRARSGHFRGVHACVAREGADSMCQLGTTESGTIWSPAGGEAKGE